MVAEGADNFPLVLGRLIVDIGEEATLVARLGGQQEFNLNQNISLDYNSADALLFDTEGERVRSAHDAPE